MKVLVRCLIALAVIASANVVQGKTLEEYIQLAQKHQKSGYLQEAIMTMEEAVKEYPESSDAYAQLGVLLGTKAQRTKGFTEVFEIIARAFEMWDRAIVLDPNNFTARFHRASWAVEVPKFLGMLDQGIEDLEFIIQALEQSPDPQAQRQLLGAYQSLGTGYQKLGDYKKAKASYEEIIQKAPGTEDAKQAEEAINQIAIFEKIKARREKNKEPDSRAITALREEIAEDPDNADLHKELGKAYLETRNYDDAEKALKEAIRIDPSDAQVYKQLALALIGTVEGGYDERIYVNTNLFTNIAFEMANVLDKAIVLAPDDMDIRLMRGIMGVEMPFFVGKLDQAIEDLNSVVVSAAPDPTKAEALYWLGAAYQKKTMTSWIEVVSNYADSRAAQMVFDDMNPGVKRFHLLKHKTPLLVADFVLGFRDELAPQTAVWIEDEDGNVVKTLYVSGFSGYAKEKQINLPIWSSSSQFADVDGVTGASINLGHHIYFWDLKDNSGRRVKSGEYTVKVEVAYWPSMKYQSVSAPIKLGKKEDRVVVEEGNFIPYLEVQYLPKGGK